jgi:hypothetical protein
MPAHPSCEVPDIPENDLRGDVSADGLAVTEVDEEPGIGSDQGPRQKAPNTGKAENGVVRKIEDGKAYSKASEVMRATIKPAQ